MWVILSEALLQLKIILSIVYECPGGKYSGFPSEGRSHPIDDSLFMSRIAVRLSDNTITFVSRSKLLISLRDFAYPRHSKIYFAWHFRVE